MPGTEKELYFIINPRSAQGKVLKWWNRIKLRIEAEGLRYGLAFTDAPGSATIKAREAVQNGYRRIIAIGGDGTVNEALNGFLDQGGFVTGEAVFGFWPAGTGNDLAKTIYPDSKDETFLKMLSDWQIKPVDIGKVIYHDFNGKRTKRYFLSDFTIGLGAETCYIVNNRSKKLGGRISFFKAALEALYRFHPVPLAVTIDDGPEMKDCFILISCTNGRYFGGGMQIAPGAYVDDGKLDLVMAAGLRKWQVFSLMTKVYQGKHLQNKNVIYRKCRKLHLECEPRLLMEVDGETPGLLPVDLEVLPGHLPMMVIPVDKDKR